MRLAGKNKRSPEKQIMIFEIVLCVIVLGLVWYIVQGRLGKKISETVEEYGKVFSDNDVSNLKMMLFPLTGCLLIAILLWCVMCGVGEVTEKIITLLAAVIVEVALGFVYIKLCTKAAQDFDGYGKMLFGAVRLYTFIPLILGIGLFLFLLATGYYIPFFWLFVVFMIATFIPVYRNYPALRNEFVKAISSNNVSTQSTQTVKTKSTESTNSQPHTVKPTKRCPYCGEEILAVAKKCKHCGEWLEKL